MPEPVIEAEHKKEESDIFSAKHKTAEKNTGHDISEDNAYAENNLQTNISSNTSIHSHSEEKHDEKILTESGFLSIMNGINNFIYQQRLLSPSNQTKSFPLHPQKGKSISSDTGHMQ